MRAALAAAGHDVIWAGDWPSDPGDEEILDQAAAQGRVLVTLDKDFGELAVPSREQSGVCAQILKAHRDSPIAQCRSARVPGDNCE